MLTATALHWLPEPELGRLYRDLHGLVRLGGVVANADDMAPAEVPQLAGALEALTRRRRAEVCADGRPDWSGWWDIVATDPVLAPAVAERRACSAATTAPASSPSAEWHAGALVDAGFAEAGVVWRSGTGAIVAAVR